MTDLHTAAKLALEALLWANNGINEWRDEAHGYTPEDQPVIMSAITALLEALAETELVQEPVCWSITYNGSHVGNVYESRAYAEERMADLNSKHPGDTRTIEPLYTAPNAQQPAPPADVPMLTEILHAIDDAAVLADFAECWIKDPSIEGMHRLKNGGVKFRLLAQAVRQKAGPT